MTISYCTALFFFIIKMLSKIKSVLYSVRKVRRTVHISYSCMFWLTYYDTCACDITNISLYNGTADTPQNQRCIIRSCLLCSAKYRATSLTTSECADRNRICKKTNRSILWNSASLNPKLHPTFRLQHSLCI